MWLPFDFAGHIEAVIVLLCLGLVFDFVAFQLALLWLRDLTNEIMIYVAFWLMGIGGTRCFRFGNWSVWVQATLLEEKRPISPQRDIYHVKLPNIINVQ